jgi:hypothetical protein
VILWVIERLTVQPRQGRDNWQPIKLADKGTKQAATTEARRLGPRYRAYKYTRVAADRKSLYS